MHKITYYKVFFILVALFFSFESKSIDNLNFEWIDNRDGLSSDYVSGIVQDHDGYMWFITLDGLNRYDGYSIKQFKNRLNGDVYFESNAFDCIEVDKNGKLWLGTKNQGIYIFNTKTEEVVNISTDTARQLFINDNKIQDLLCDSKGRMWISTYHGVSRYDPEYDKIIIYEQDYNDPPKAPLGNVSCIYEDSKGRIIFGTWANGLYIYNEEKDAFKNIIIQQTNLEPKGEVRIWSLLEDEYGYLWIGTWTKGLLQTRLLENSIQYIDHFYLESGDPEKRIIGDIVFALQQTDDGVIWVATSTGLNLITKPYEKKKEILSFSEGNSSKELSISEVYDVAQDVSGSVWLATMGGGVNKIDLKRYSYELFHIDKTVNGNYSQIVSCFLPVSEDKYYLGVRSMGIGLYDFKNHTFTGFQDLKEFEGLPSDLNTIYYILRDSRSNLWLGSRYYGLLKKDGNTGEWETVIPRNYFSVNALFSVLYIKEDRFNHLWVGTTEGLLRLTYNYEIDQYDIVTILPDSNKPYSISGKNITSILIDSEKSLWVTTEDGGLNKLKNNLQDDSQFEFENYNITTKDKIALKSNTINVITEDSKNRIWVGTGSNGVLQYDRTTGVFKSFPEIEELIGVSVYNIIPDESDFLWLTTNKGLVRLSVNGDDINIQNFTSEDGLQSNIFNRGAWYKDDKGRIYIGGNYGINRFDPTEFRANNFIPPVVITDVRLNNMPTEIERIKDNNLVLQHTENNFSFTISALSYSQVRKNKFSYKLEGFDDEWIMTDYNNRNAVYTNIPPGEYTFLAKAANNSWIWNPEPVRLSITIKPSPFFSQVAISIYILLFFGIIYMFFRIRLKSLKVQQALEIEKIQRTKKEKINQFKLRFFTNISHELLTPLSIISYGVNDLSSNVKEDKSLINSINLNVKRLTLLINQLLDFRKLETGNMKLSVNKVSADEVFKRIYDLYIPYARHKNIDFFVEGSIEELIYIDDDKVRTILSNLVSNAFKYTDKKGKIKMSYGLDKERDLLNIEIGDTGIGISEKEVKLIFERFYQSTSKSSENSGFGIGLHLVKSLVELHKGSISVKNNQDGFSTIFTVTLPANRDSYSKNELELNKEKEDSKPLLIEDLDYFDEKLIVSNQHIYEKDENFKVLIVEDNNELRKYLVTHISKLYKVIDAPNGLSGYELAKKENPDLIVSDIIMPKMNGIELCQKIKEDFNYNHILFILVTAKISNTDRSEGYLAGADSYLSKPLNLDLLLARIDSLKKQREIIKERYLTGLINIEQNQKISANNIDIMKQFTREVMGNLNDPDLNVSMLAEKFNLSHSTLYRKIQNITGMPPNEFIRNIRLNEAAKLLINTDLNIAEIIVVVGFNDQSYFTKCFKKKYNLTPKEYVLNNKKQKKGETAR